MSDLPQPDLRDQSGRARRLVLALMIGAAVAAIAFFVSSELAADERDNPYNWKGGPTRFIWYMTGFFGAAGFMITLAVVNRRAKKKWREQQVAQARALK